MTPVEVWQPQNYGSVYFICVVADNFKIGDTVRISKYKRKSFDKGYAPNWNEEVFIIDKIQFTNPITYKIRYQKGELIKGTFYKKELQKTDQNIYRIVKIIRKTKYKALVKWKGYPDDIIKRFKKIIKKT